jgi:aspartate carbamoyltransferase regulatory subunit
MCFECQKLSWSSSESERHQQLFHFARGNTEPERNQDGNTTSSVKIKQQAINSSVIEKFHASKTELCSLLELETDYQCHYCRQAFQLYSSLLAHLELQHPGQESLRCFSCSFQATSRLGLKAHLMALHSEKYILVKCMYCNAFFSDNANLEVSVANLPQYFHAGLGYGWACFRQ